MDLHIFPKTSIRPLYCNILETVAIALLSLQTHTNISLSEILESFSLP
jgi:hypothetical protein